MSVAGLIISILSLCISLLTAWLTLFRRGRLKMTRPSIVFFGFDDLPRATAKIFLRTLLFSSSVRGQVIEGMYVKLRRQDQEYTFSFWGYGEATALVPGSGLYVGQTGVAANHHFVWSLHRPPFEFATGEHTVQVYARVVGHVSPIKLSEVCINITPEQGAVLSRHHGMLFELEPDGRSYVGRTRERI